LTTRHAALVGLVLSLFALAAPPATADDGMFGVRLGYYTEAEAAFVGGEALFKLAPSLYLNPNVEWVFVDNARYITINGDVHYDFKSSRRTFFWAGAGLALLSFNPEGPSDGDTDVGLNLLAGVGTRRGSIIPYVQAKIIAKEDTEFVLALGVRF
jgi:hypothetical protein